MEIRIKSPLLWTTLGLITLGVVMRIVPHPANLAPVGAIALFGGAVLPRKIGWWLPVVVMVLSDLWIGTYDGIVFTWLGFLLVGLFGMSLRGRSNWLRVPLGVASSSVIFFVISNLGVWLQGKLYAHTWDGLWQCYVNALPFFRNTALGDLIYATLLFGVYALAEARVKSQQKTTA